jgi:flagellar biosynthesis/type III secretory pathway M-ring protein FliF/YscJ
MKSFLKWMAIGVGGIWALLVVWIGSYAVLNPSSLKDKQTAPAISPEEAAAKALAKKNDSNGAMLKRRLIEACKKKLKAPTTAKFDFGYDVSSDGKTIVVGGTIDSQNSFGAMIRSRVTALYNAETLEIINLDWKDQ